MLKGAGLGKNYAKNTENYEREEEGGLARGCERLLTHLYCMPLHLFNEKIKERYF